LSRLYISYRPVTPTPPIPPVIYEPEVEIYLDAIGVPNDGTVYYGSTAYEITGAELWTNLDLCVKSIKNAIGLTLEVNNLSTKFKFIFPRIGGTSTAHRYNLVTGTADGTFSGGWTHDGSGALPNGTNAYMTTGFNYNATNFAQNSQSFGFFSKTNNDGLYSDFGAFPATFAGVNMYTNLGGNCNTRLAVAGTNSTTSISSSEGFISMSRTGSANYKHYRNGSSIGTITIASDVMPVTGIVITEAANNNNGSIIQYSPRKRTWFYGGVGFTDAETLDIYNALYNFEIALNR
jgi:hypothetical protein